MIRWPESSRPDTVFDMRTITPTATRARRARRGRASLGVAGWTALGAVVCLVAAFLPFVASPEFVAAYVAVAAAAGAVVGLTLRHRRRVRARERAADDRRCAELQLAYNARRRARDAQTLREVLCRGGFDALTPVDAGAVVLEPNERAHLAVQLHYSRLSDGRWVRGQWCDVVVTTSRIVARTVDSGDLGFWWNTVTSIYLTEADSPTDWPATTLHFAAAPPLTLRGPSAALVGIYATGQCKGVAALAHASR